MEIIINTKDVGDISEACVTAKFLKLGFIVLKPFVDNQRYDLVIDRGFGFERVQVKTANYKEDYFTFECRSSYAHRGKGTKDYIGDIELFAVYCHEIDSFYIVPINEAPTATMTLRLNPPANGQVKNIKFASDFMI
ncbi:hypothetical protein D3C84_904970 [compost metagenome]